MEAKLLKITEAAARAGIGRTLAYDFVARGEWPSVKIGRALRIPLTGLDAWIGEREADADRRAMSLRGDRACDAR